MFEELKEKNVLVTGANGFIGKHLVSKLNSLKAKVIAPTSQECDVAEKEQVLVLIEKHKPEIIYHLAAKLSKKIEDVEQVFDANVVGTKNILEASRNSDSVKKIILIGSSEDINNNSVYGATKKIVSELGIMYSKNTDMQIVILKPFIVYGAGQKNNMFIPAMMKAYKSGEVFGMSSGEQKRDFVYVDDCVDVMIIASLSDATEEVIEIGTGKPIALLDVVKQMKQLTQDKFNYDNTVYQMREGEVMEYYADVGKAEKLFGWKAKINIEEGLKKTLEWWEKNE